MTEYIRIKVKNNEIITIDVKIAKKSEILNNLIDISNENISDIPIFSFINKELMYKIIEFIEYHLKIPMKKIQKPMKSNNLKECGVLQWDIDFINSFDDTELLIIATSSDIFIIPDLFELTSLTLASKLYNKSISVLRHEYSSYMTESEINTLNNNNCWYND